MKTLIKTLAVTTALTTATIAPMQAHAAIESLADCYQAVLTWCNETYPDADCSNASGLDDCDEVFGDTLSQTGVTFRLSTMRTVDYTETGTMEDALNAAADGRIGDVASER